MSSTMFPSSAMLLLASLFFPALNLAASTAVATSPIVTTITSTYYSTTSSSVGTSVSTSSGSVSCSVGTESSSVQTTLCLAAPVQVTSLTLYGTSVVELTSTIVSTIGYTTEYGAGPDTTTSSSLFSSSTDSSTTSVTSSVASGTSSAISHEPPSSSAIASKTIPNPAIASTSPASDSSDSNTSNSLGPKVALAVAIVVGLIFASLGVGYLIKKHRDRKFKRSIGAPQPGSLEKGGITGFVAMTEMKKPETSTTTLSTIHESRPETATPKVEQLATNVRDPPIIGGSVPRGPSRGAPVGTHLPVSEVQGAAVFEAPSRPSISADELPPRAGSLHQRRASTESTKTTTTIRFEADSDHQAEVCTNPFHQAPCNCRKALMMQQGHDSLYEDFSQSKHETAGQARFGAGSSQVYEAAGHQRFEAHQNPRYELSTNPILELEDTSMGIGTAR